MEAHAPARLRPLQILVADDDEDMLALVCDSLRADGHQLHEVHDGAELLERLEHAIDHPEERPDVVVADVMMPKLSGLGVLEAIRRARLHFPVVLMTVLADDSIWVVGRRLGAVGVLRKPFDVDDLRTAVVNAVLAYSASRASRD